METPLIILYFIGFLWAIYKLRFFETRFLTRNQLAGLFTLKVMAGFAFYYIYTRHYTYRYNNDAFKYFDDGYLMFNILKEDPAAYFKMVTGIGSQDELAVYYNQMTNWYKEYNYNLYNDNRIVIRFNALAMLFSFGIYHIHTLAVCFLSLTGLIGIYKILEDYMPGKELWLQAVIFLVPSVVFWTSGVLKEGLLIFCFGLLFYQFFKLKRYKTEKWRLILIILALFFLVQLKFYVLLAAIPGFICLNVPFRSRLQYITNCIAIHVVLIGLVLILPKLNPQLNVLETVSRKQSDFINSASGGLFLIDDSSRDTIFVESDSAGYVMLRHDTATVRVNAPFYKFRRGVIDKQLLYRTESTRHYRLLSELGVTGSFVEVSRLTTLETFVRSIPEALVNCLLRPYIWESNSLFMLLAGLENIFFAVFILLAIIYRQSLSSPQIPIAIFCCSFVLILSLVIGWTTPVLGAIVRYKVPFLPFLYVLILFYFNPAKLTSRFLKPS